MTAMNRSFRFRFAPLIVALGMLVAAPSFAQTAEDKTTVIGLNLLGPMVGLYSGSFEQVLDDDLSIFVIPAYYNAKFGIFNPLPPASTGIVRDDYDVWSVSIAAGANYYVNGVSPTGVFAGAWLSPGYASARFQKSALKDPTGTKLESWTVLIGAGAHVGYRVIWGPVALTPRVGVSYQLALSPFTGFKTGMKGMENVVANVNSGLRFPWSIELAIAF